MVGQTVYDETVNDGPDIERWDSVRWNKHHTVGQTVRGGTDSALWDRECMPEAASRGEQHVIRQQTKGNRWQLQAQSASHEDRSLSQTSVLLQPPTDNRHFTVRHTHGAKHWAVSPLVPKAGIGFFVSVTLMLEWLSLS